MTDAMKVSEYRTIVNQACRAIDLWSQDSVQLVVQTACHESQLEFRRQFGNGPAKGLPQIEDNTFLDIDKNYLFYQKDLRAKVAALLKPGEKFEPEALVNNDLFAAAMCRVHYRRAKPKLPRWDDSDAIAWYWKNWFNTRLGAGTVDDFKDSFINLVNREAWSAL